MNLHDIPYADPFIDYLRKRYRAPAFNNWERIGPTSVRYTYGGGDHTINGAEYGMTYGEFQDNPHEYDPRVPR